MLDSSVQLIRMTRSEQTRRRIILAVSSGCVNFRQVADCLGVNSSTVSNYFYGDLPMPRFQNGHLLAWEPGKANTLRLADGARLGRVNGRPAVAKIYP